MAFFGQIFLAIWLILMGSVQALDLKFHNREKIMGGFAIIAGVIYLIGALRP